MNGVSIVIPCWGERHYLDECLESLRGTLDGAEVILSLDGIDWNVTADQVVRNPEHRGFSATCNAGAAVAKHDLICFLNMDTLVRPGWLEPLVAAMDDAAVAMCGPRIIHPDGSLQTASGIRTWHGNGSAGGEELKIDGPSCDADGVTGACMVIRQSVFDTVRGFDLAYINGYDDVSLCLSVREAGWRIRYVSESTIMHHESVSGPERWAHAHQNVATMNAQWGNR